MPRILKYTTLVITMIFCLTSCKKDEPPTVAEGLSESQKKIQGKWTQTYFKRYDYNEGVLDRVVEGRVTTGEYIEFSGNTYRYHDGLKLVESGSTFYFDGDELAIRQENRIFYTTIKWQSADSFIEVRDDGSSAGGPANKSVFEYTYVRSTN